MHNDKELHIECACHSHALHIERDPRLDKLWYGSFWMRGYSQKDFWWRWRVLWHVLKTGKPYGDEVVLTREHLQELSEYISEQLKSTETKS